MDASSEPACFTAENTGLCALCGKDYSVSLQTTWQARRRKQFRKFAPAFLGIGAAAFFDVTLHHVLPEIVIDHVTPIPLDEFDPLLSAGRLHHLVFLQPFHRGLLVDLAINESSCGLVSGVSQLLRNDVLDGVIFVRARRIDPSRWK